MAAKVVRVSDDSGSSYYTLPGNQGEWRDEVSVLDDTIFGQNYQSGQTNLITWSVSANALYKGFAGYMVNIKKSGSSTPFTDEATTLVTGKTYKITDATKSVWDRSVATTFEDNAVAIDDANIESIDYLFGTVTFTSGYSVTGPITVATGSYKAMTQLARYRNFSLTMTMEPIDDTDIPTAQANSGHRTHIPGLKTVNLEVSGVYASSNGYRAALVARDELMIEIDPGNAAKARARGFFKPSTRSQSGNVGELEEETAAFVLQVPTTEKLKAPFQWDFSSTTDISTAVRKCIEAWQNDSDLRVRYLPDGTNGLQGDGVVSDVSLQGGLEAMNEFSVTVTGSGAVTAVP